MLRLTEVVPRPAPHLGVEHLGDLAAGVFDVAGVGGVARPQHGLHLADQ
jgi:hypothetical protein